MKTALPIYKHRDVLFRRNSVSGSVLLLTIVFAGLIFCSIALGSWLFRYVAIQTKQQVTTEAAALACAQELSKIVVDDPYFGYVSLTEQEGGKHTLLPSYNESMPVHGINSILANIRQCRLLAQHLNDPQLQAVTDTEFKYALQTIKLLKQAFEDAAKPSSSKRLAQDVNGKPVNLNKTAREVFVRYGSPVNLAGVNLELSIGQLNGGGPSTTPAPLPDEIGMVNKSDLYGSNYKSCVKIPCQGLDFIFAAVSNQATLAETGSFQETQKDQLGSVVRLSISQKIDNQVCIGSTACAIPPAYHVTTDYPTLLMVFPLGTNTEVITPADMLRAGFSGGAPLQLQAVNGDFPVDEGCAMQQDCSNSEAFEYVLNEVVYDWLRSNNVSSSETLKSILDIFNAPLVTSMEKSFFSSPNLAYYFDRDGKLHRHLFLRNPFYKDFVSESQISGQETLSFNAAQATMSYIDNVRNISTTDSGKHGGKLIDISIIDGPSVLSSNLEDEMAYQRRFFQNATVPHSDPLPYTLKFAGQLQIAGNLEVLAAPGDR
jgi:hypothetical protein